MRKNANEKTIELLAYRDGAAFQYLYKIFKASDVISGTENNFSEVKRVFIE